MKVYDHHFGFENYWKSRLGINAKIEKVGACATLIWEEYVNNKLVNQIEPFCAELLYLAIIANTLNLKAFVTSERDRLALSQIEEIVKIPKDLKSSYYEEINRKILFDFEYSLSTDIKQITVNNTVCVIAQLEIWNSDDLLNTEHFRNDKIAKILCNFIQHKCLWFLIISDIMKGKNIIYTSCSETKTLLKQQFTFTFNGDFALTKRLWMRKEFVRDLEGDSKDEKKPT